MATRVALRATVRSDECVRSPASAHDGGAYLDAVQTMVNLVELRNTALILRQWAKEIRNEIGRGPVEPNEIGTLEKAAKLMEEAADEIDRNRWSDAK